MMRARKTKNSSELEFSICCSELAYFLSLNSCFTIQSEKRTAIVAVPTAEIVAITDMFSPPERYTFNTPAQIMRDES